MSTHKSILHPLLLPRYLPLDSMRERSTATASAEQNRACQSNQPCTNAMFAIPQLCFLKVPGARDPSLGLVPTCLLVMEFRLDTMLCSNLGNANSDAGRIKCSRGPKVPHSLTYRMSRGQHMLMNDYTINNCIFSYDLVVCVSSVRLLLLRN